MVNTNAVAAMAKLVFLRMCASALGLPGIRPTRTG
jgi:hypothetical protein